MPDLKEALETLAERQSAETSTDFDAVLTAARVRRQRRTGSWVAVVAAVIAIVVVSFALVPQSKSVVPAQVPQQTPAPLSLVLTPSTAAPGDRIVATFPDGISRGLEFILAEADSSPSSMYVLLSRVPGDSRPPAYFKVALDRPVTGLPIPAYAGPGPDDLIVPSGLQNGSYRICVNSKNRLCGLLTVRR
ncbi:hypothetical protein [Kribbella sp. NPDC055071]